MMRLHLPGGKLKLLLPLVVIIALAGTSYAATVSVSSSSYQAQYGISYDISAAFTGQDQGFATVNPGKTASSQPCTWTTTGASNTALTKSDYQYSARLTLNTPPATTTTYALTIKWSQNSGTMAQMCQLTFSVPSTASAGQYMTFSCDTGGSSFVTPLTIDVTVA